MDFAPKNQDDDEVIAKPQIVVEKIEKEVTLNESEEEYEREAESFYLSKDEFIVMKDGGLDVNPLETQHNVYTELLDVWLDKEDRPHDWVEHKQLQNASESRKDVTVQQNQIEDNEKLFMATSKPVKSFLNKVELKKLPAEQKIEQKGEDKTKVTTQIQPPFNMNTNQVSFDQENGFQVGLGLTIKQMGNMHKIDKQNNFQRFNWTKALAVDAENKKNNVNDMSAAWEKFRLNVSEDETTYLQSPLTCVIDDHIQMQGGYINKNKQHNELQKLYLNYRDKEATWQIVEFDDIEEERDEDTGEVLVQSAGCRSHSKKMIHVKDNNTEQLYFQGGVREADGVSVSLNDLKRFVLQKEVCVEHIRNIDPGRASHFFEKCNNDSFLIGLGQDQTNVVPLSDFLMYERSTNICYSIFLNFDFLPEQNVSWTDLDERFIVIFGGKVHGMLFVIDKEDTNMSQLKYSSRKSESSAETPLKVNSQVYYPLDFFDNVEQKGEQKHWQKLGQQSEGDQKQNITIKACLQEDLDHNPDLSTMIEHDFRQDRGGIMIYNKQVKRKPCTKKSQIKVQKLQKVADKEITVIELWALPCHMFRDKIRKQELLIQQDKEIPVDTQLYDDKCTFWDQKLYSDMDFNESTRPNIITQEEIEKEVQIMKNNELKKK